MKLFGDPAPKPGVDHEAENRRLKRELARMTEERDILKKGEACPPLVRGQCRARTSPGSEGMNAIGSSDCLNKCGTRLSLRTVSSIPSAFYATYSASIRVVSMLG